MTVSQSQSKTTDRAPAPPAGSRGGKSRYRKLLGGLLLALVVLAVLAAGGWGVISSLTTGQTPARIGETVEVPGGLLRVEKVTPESMAPMQMSSAQAPSGSAGEGMERAPKGYRRFTVEVTLVGRESGGFAYSADDFRLTGEGVKESGVVRSQLAAGTLPEGSAIAGGLVFQAPKEAKGLTLSFDGGRPVALNLNPAEGGRDSGASKEAGHSHDR